MALHFPYEKVSPRNAPSLFGASAGTFVSQLEPVLNNITRRHVHVYDVSIHWRYLYKCNLWSWPRQENPEPLHKLVCTIFFRYSIHQTDLCSSRKLKVRCDGRKPACSYCARQYKACQYLFTTTRGGKQLVGLHGPPSGAHPLSTATFAHPAGLTGSALSPPYAVMP